MTKPGIWTMVHGTVKPAALWVRIFQYTIGNALSYLLWDMRNLCPALVRRVRRIYASSWMDAWRTLWRPLVIKHCDVPWSLISRPRRVSKTCTYRLKCHGFPWLHSQHLSIKGERPSDLWGHNNCLLLLPVVVLIQHIHKGHVSQQVQVQRLDHLYSYRSGKECTGTGFDPRATGRWTITPRPISGQGMKLRIYSGIHFFFKFLDHNLIFE